MQAQLKSPSGIPYSRNDFNHRQSQVGDVIDATVDSLENMAVCIGDVLTEITSLGFFFRTNV
jgi:hypothetical protein